MHSQAPNLEEAATDRHGAAKYLSVCRRTVANRMADGTLPFVKFNPRCVRFLIKDLDAYLAKYRVGGSANE
jgi:excisionase family DNA binding protein